MFQKNKRSWSNRAGEKFSAVRPKVRNTGENSKRWKTPKFLKPNCHASHLSFNPGLHALSRVNLNRKKWQCSTCVLSAGQSWGSSSEGWMQLQPAQISLGAILGDNEPLTNNHICPFSESWTKVVITKVTIMVIGYPILENLHELFLPAEFWPLHHLFLHCLLVSPFGYFLPEQRSLSNLSWITLKRQTATFSVSQKY